MRSRLALLAAGCILISCQPIANAEKAHESQPVNETNIEIAKTWWPELVSKWTAVGWKDHLMRFSVLHNGTIMNTYAWLGKTRPACPDPQSQFAFIPAESIDGIPAQPEGTNAYYDDGTVHQGWNDCNTPVLYSEWAVNSCLVRQEVFAHISGGTPVVRGDEPLFAWVRLSVVYAAEGLPLPDKIGFGIRINAAATNLSMKRAYTLSYHPNLSKYARTLTPDSEQYNSTTGLRLIEPDGRVRFAVAPNQQCSTVFRSGFPSANDSNIFVQMPAKVGNHIDVLVPMLPTDRKIMDEELALGYDKALDQAEKFWSNIPKTAATLELPEDYVTQAIRRSVQFSEVMAEKDPPTGEYAMLTGAMGYGVGTWSTPVSMTLVDQLDRMGYHSAVEKYLKVYKAHQGEVLPPGDHFKLHPGYLGTPQRLAVVNWLPDHGAILWAIAQHALLTNDKRFIEEYTPVIIKACEWIKYARRINPEGAVPGIMPPAGASDDESRIQSCWTDGWIYKGLTTSVKLLERINHPRTKEFADEAYDYRSTFMKAFRSKTLTMPQWTDAKGEKHHFIPFSMSGENDAQLRHIFYLDSGPMFLVFSGLMDADNELMRSSVEYFRSGPPVRLYRESADYNHIPSLHHEVSSWEQCYSWNIFHSWQLGDRARYLEGMYSLFVGVISQQTYTCCEERNGMSALIPAAPFTFFARSAIIDDQVSDNELHLMRLMPLAWLKTDQKANAENIPTYFGPVTLHAQLSDGGKTLLVTFNGKYHAQPEKVVLHVPPVKGLRKIILNGKELEWNKKSESIILK